MRTIFITILCTFLCVFTACGEKNTSSETRGQRNPGGKADALEVLCLTKETNLCGSETPSGCWCDEQCAEHGDCCLDAAESCGVNECFLPDAVDEIETCPLGMYCEPGELNKCISTECPAIICYRKCHTFAVDSDTGCLICDCVDDGVCGGTAGWHCPIGMYCFEDPDEDYPSMAGGVCQDCFDPEDPSVHYAEGTIEEPTLCWDIDFSCDDNQEIFDNECGCGCIDK